jgi:hypothetical protein
MSAEDPGPDEGATMAEMIECADAASQLTDGTRIEVPMVPGAMFRSLTTAVREPTGWRVTGIPDPVNDRELFIFGRRWQVVSRR